MSVCHDTRVVAAHEPGCVGDDRHTDARTSNTVAKGLRCGRVSPTFSRLNVRVSRETRINGEQICSTISRVGRMTQAHSRLNRHQNRARIPHPQAVAQSRSRSKRHPPLATQTASANKLCAIPARAARSQEPRPAIDSRCDDVAPSASARPQLRVPIAHGCCRSCDPLRDSHRGRLR